MKQIVSLLLCLTLWVQPALAADFDGMIRQEEETKETEEKADGAEVELSAPSALLMEASTGQVIYEKNADEPMPPASVTKVMTLLLIFDALEEEKISLEDEVTTSEYAASMGGSQVFLEPGEVQTVDTMIKCIAVASANDACVAMAEYICGSEEEFVSRMNERAKGLGMERTTFINCNGLDAEGHLTTARDIALMSRELITSYPKIRDYCMIWMEDITHTTKKGTSTFGLSNTNKLVRHYEYATGLKTGSTSEAGFCISATAKKDGMELIGVIMAAKTSKERTKDAVALLNYGFGKCTRYAEEEAPETEAAKVQRGVEDSVATMQKEPFTYVDTSGADLSAIERKAVWGKNLKAPVKEGDKVGEAVYTLNGEEIGRVDIVAAESVEPISYQSAAKDTIDWFLL
ncbi:MAG TPA: D-alanyl-D-alanine carboxypeptidase [Candidatus Dorea gallistercoris]|uniref:serine-type D-Ala-D-Ala carboxypeptidase n=1 Tax=Candidatus Dorea gallistercoris TaxID=2838542 RepID=A0A9D1RA49_9FIRM|nr:D-alanyl-D-alanine carboxypeptidase [Candidatus Dorea gallistercoris]